MKKQLEQIVERALQNQLDKRGFNSSKQLLGECQHNTAALAKELEKENIPYTIYCGAMENSYPPNELPESAEETIKDGFGVHYWLESHGYICEISSEAYIGKPTVTSKPPEKLGYIIFKDSTEQTLL